MAFQISNITNGIGNAFSSLFKNTPFLCRSETKITEWAFPNDTREVTLCRTSDDSLIYRVYDAATNESQRWNLEGKASNKLASLLENKRPILLGIEKGPVCGAVFIRKDAVILGRMYGGVDGEIEGILIQYPDEGCAWVINDWPCKRISVFPTSKNKEDSLYTLKFYYISEIVYDEKNAFKKVLMAKKIVHMWPLEGVRLERGHKTLKCVVSGHGEGMINLYPDLTIEECIEQIKKLIPHFDEGGTLRFLRPKKYQCILSDDDKDIVDEDNWAVRLAMTGECNFTDPKTWVGHTVILIEGVHPGGFYFIERADLVKNKDGSGNAVTRKWVITDSFLRPEKKHIKGLSPETWIRPKAEIDKIRKAIEEDERKQTANPRHIIFWSAGFDRSTRNPLSYLTRYVRNIISRQSVRVMPHNCLSWAKEKLSLAGIDFSPLTAKRVLTVGQLLAPSHLLDPISKHRGFVEKVPTNPYLY
jgi:hypothetical protein